MLDEQDFVSAMVTLERAAREGAGPRALFHLGRAYRGAGRLRLAVDAWDRYLAAPEPDASPTELARVRAERALVAAQCLRVRLRFAPASAVVTIDGEPVAPVASAVSADGAREWLLDPRPHRIAVRAQGYREWSTTVGRERAARSYSFEVTLASLNDRATVSVGGRPIPWWTWLGAGMIVGGTTAAIALAVDRDRAAAQCRLDPACATAMSTTAVDGRNAGIGVSVAVIGAGAALVVAGIILGPASPPTLANTTEPR